MRPCKISQKVQRKSAKPPFFFVATSGGAAALSQTLLKAHTRGDQAEFLITHTQKRTHSHTQFLMEASKANG